MCQVQTFIQNMKSYHTLGARTANCEGTKRMEQDLQRRPKFYHSAVGTLLYLLKYSRLCLDNPLRELPNALDGLLCL